MGFFNNIFRNNKSNSNAHYSTGLSVSSPSTNIMDGDTSSLETEKPKQYVTLSAATGYPIDAIYDYVLRDLEEEGYNDALVNSDMTYCQQKECILKNKLDLLFERVTLIYKEKIRKIETKTRLANEAMIQSAVESLSASHETLNEHMVKLAEMQRKAKAGDETFLNMIASYRRGFTKGLAAACEQLVSNNYNTISLVKDDNIK